MVHNPPRPYLLCIASIDGITQREESIVEKNRIVFPADNAHQMGNEAVGNHDVDLRGGTRGYIADYPQNLLLPRIRGRFHQGHENVNQARVDHLLSVVIILSGDDVPGDAQCRTLNTRILRADERHQQGRVDKGNDFLLLLIRRFGQKRKRPTHVGHDFLVIVAHQLAEEFEVGPDVAEHAFNPLLVPTQIGKAPHAVPYGTLDALILGRKLDDPTKPIQLENHLSVVVIITGNVSNGPHRLLCHFKHATLKEIKERGNGTCSHHCHRLVVTAYTKGNLLGGSR